MVIEVIGFYIAPLPLLFGDFGFAFKLLSNDLIVLLSVLSKDMILERRGDKHRGL